MPTRLPAAIALATALLAVPAAAMAADAAAPGTETVSVRVVHARSATRHDMERRIAAAAMEACGASGFSAPGVKEAVGRSACWRDSYAAGIAQLDRGGPADVAALPPGTPAEQP